MSTGIINSTNECRSNSLRKKSSFRYDGSYRIFHITKKQKEDSDEDEENISSKTTRAIIEKENEIKNKSHKKSFKISNRNGLDGWKRKSTKNKRLLFLHKTSCESTSNELKTPPSSSHLLTNDLSSSLIVYNNQNKQTINQNKQTINHNELSESDALVETIDETITNNNVTLHDLLNRANQLQTTVNNQEFNKIQPLSHTNIDRRRKQFLIACSTLLIVLTVIIIIVIFILIMMMRHKKYKNYVRKSPTIYDG